MKAKLTKTDVLLEELLFRVHQLINCDGFRESGLDEILPIICNAVRDAALHQAEKGVLFTFPEFGIYGGKDRWPPKRT